MLWLLCVSLLLVASGAHPTHYPNATTVNCRESPEILSYHAHIVFDLMVPEHIAKAAALRNEARAAFAEYLGPDCAGRYDEGRLCLIFDHPINETLRGGPFPIGEWSMFVPVDYYGLVMPWFTQHRQEFSFLAHPNTGCEYEDHDDWALWGGSKWPLNFNIFKKNRQTNEFNAHRGDAGNPVCQAEQQVCGTAADNSTINCCSGLACACDANGKCVCQ